MGQDPSEVRHQVDEAREQLGDTVEALAYKVNAPKRLKERATAKVESAGQRVRTDPRLEKVQHAVAAAKERLEKRRTVDPAGGGWVAPDMAGATRAKLGASVRKLRAQPRPVKAAALIGAASGLVIGAVVARRSQ